MKYLHPAIGIFLCLLLSVLFITGCKKDKNIVNNNIKPVLITSAVEVDANHITDTLETNYFDYDDANRLIKLSNWFANSQKQTTYNFFYDASGNLTHYTFDQTGIDQENFVLTFNSGLLVTETYTPTGFGASYIQNIQYSNNNNTVVFTNNIDTTARDTFVYNNNNLVRRGQRTNSVYLDNYVYTYGNHKGPYASINLKYFFSELIPKASANEILTTTVTTIYPSVPPNINISTGSSSYMYNAQGYAVKETDADQNSQPVSITYFNYKNGN